MLLGRHHPLPWFQSPTIVWWLSGLHLHPELQLHGASSYWTLLLGKFTGISNSTHPKLIPVPNLNCSSLDISFPSEWDPHAPKSETFSHRDTALPLTPHYSHLLSHQALTILSFKYTSAATTSFYLYSITSPSHPPTLPAFLQFIFYRELSLCLF